MNAVKQCLGCKVELKGNQKYCSEGCWINLNGNTTNRHKYIQMISRKNVVDSGRSIDKCERCSIVGKPSAFMIVHHRDRNRENNLSQNLEVLCGSCHRTAHHRDYKIERQCKGCSQTFMARLRQSFCTADCYTVYHRKNKTERGIGMKEKLCKAKVMIAVSAETKDKFRSLKFPDYISSDEMRFRYIIDKFDSMR